MSETPDLEVKRDDTRSAYTAEVDGEQAVIAFKDLGGGKLDFQHTSVAPALRGKGVGEELVRQALADARRRGLKVVPTCPFVAAYVRRHREYGDLVAER